MKRVWTIGAALAAMVVVAQAGEVQRITVPGGGGYAQPYGGYGQYGKQSGELTIEEQRKLGLSEDQIRKIAELRRELEKEKAKLEEQLAAARAAAAASNAEVARLNGMVVTITTQRIRKVYESVMTPDQLKTWSKQEHLDQAKQYLRGYMRWLNLTEDQVADIAQLLVPVYEKYDRMQEEADAAKARLAELRTADKIDVAAIEEAEKQVAELSKVNVYTERYKELREAIRPGLMPDQLEKYERMGRR